MYINWTTDLFESLWKEGWVNKSWPNANKPTLKREIIFVSQIKVCVGWGTWLSEMWPSQLTSSSDCVFVCFWVFFKLKKHICKCWDGIAVSEMWMPGFESLVWQKLTSFLNTQTKWESSNKRYGRRAWESWTIWESLVCASWSLESCHQTNVVGGKAEQYGRV